MSTLFIIALSIYLLSVFACWNWMRIAYSDGGVDSDKTITITDVIIALMPALNTLIAFIAWTTQCPRKDGVKLTVKWLNLIFCIKKDEE